MIKKINDNLSLHYETFFPYSKNVQSRNYRVLIGIGGNIGNSKRRFEKLFNILENRIKISLPISVP